jgi:DedD protein
MGLLSFFRPDKTSPRTVQRGREDIGLVRVRARRRLIGAVVLVTSAVVGLPWLLETQPRPLSADITSDTSRDGPSTPLGPTVPAPRPLPVGDAPAQARPGDAAASMPGAPAPSETLAVAAVASMPMRSAQGATPPLASAPRTAQTTVAPVTAAVRPPVAPAPAPKPVAAPVRAAPTVAEVRPAPPAPPARPATPARADEARAKATPDAKPPAAAVSTRFVVQVGAFEHAAAAHETRGKVEKLGLKAFEQEVDTGGARRIRVRLGPYASREEAERMLTRLRASGLNASVMPQ